VDQSRELIEFSRPTQDVDVRNRSNSRVPSRSAMQPMTPITVPAFPSSARAVRRGAPHFLLGMLAHRTGVVEDDVGVIARLGRHVPLPAELAEDELAVEHVHLAAEVSM
jgi:hypothetical protein